MTRLLITAVIIVVMAVVAIQNPQATALTFLGSQQTPELPFGLLLVIAFSAGSLLTIFLYGLIGLKRPSASSKYQPMGRRVPYPENPSDSSFSSPNSSSTRNTATQDAAPPYATINQNYGRSTAFVSDSSPQDTPPQAAAPIDPPPDSSYTPPASTNVASSIPEAVIDEPKPEKKKSRFKSISNPLSGNLINKKAESEPTEKKRVGDGWGELRTAEHINSWDTQEVRRAVGAAEPSGKRGILDFIGVGSAASKTQSADHLADDIAAGWDNSQYENSQYENSQYEAGAYDNRVYEDDLDSGWEQGYSQSGETANAPQRRVYRDGIYSEADYSEGDYSEAGYAEGPYAGEYAEGPYDEAYAAEGRSEEGIENDSEDVYEADYRVIVPPSKPLEEISEEGDEPYA